MNPWLIFVDAVRFALFAAAHLLGGSVGAGILAFSVVLRIAMLPITLPAARRMREQQAKLRALKPELDRLATKYKANPRAFVEARSSLLTERGVSTMSGFGVALVHAPVGMAMLLSLRQGVARGTRFLWIRDLTRPDLALALIAAGISAFAARLSGADNPRVAMLISASITFYFAWRMSASIGLYSIASSGVSAAESLALAIAERRKPA
ncbi:MAG TPA: YidC/Oxa1 family membrane protein insertase [Gemmatimonadaceae bacterium]|jgi:YidC/Oxa1 family membrane protein insertase